MHPLQVGKPLIPNEIKFCIRNRIVTLFNYYNVYFYMCLSSWSSLFHIVEGPLVSNCNVLSRRKAMVTTAYVQSLPIRQVSLH